MLTENTQHQPAKSVYFENLDGLRFVCFLMVFLFHSFHTTNREILDNPVYDTVKKTLFGNGLIGVNAFFVLSGFLITYLLLQEKERFRKIHIGNFWMRRLLRIWPLYFACVIFGFFVFPVLKSITHEVYNENAHLITYLTFTSNFEVIKQGLPDASSLGVLWSIAIEEQFYLFWPILFLIFPSRKIWIPILVIIAASFTYRYFFAYLHYRNREYHTLSCMNDLAIGGLGAWLIIFKDSFKRFFVELKRHWIILGYVLFGLLFFFREQYLHFNFTTFMAEKITTSLLMLFIILEQCYSQHSFYKFSKFKWITQWGKFTYGLYCLQFIGILITLKLTGFLHLNTELWQVLILETILSLGITILLAKFSYRYFESYFLKLKNKFN